MMPFPGNPGLKWFSFLGMALLSGYVIHVTQCHSYQSSQTAFTLQPLFTLTFILVFPGSSEKAHLHRRYPLSTHLLLLPLTTCCAVTSPYFFLFFKIILQFVIICLAIRKNIFINLFSFFFSLKDTDKGNKDLPFPGSPSQIPLSIRVGPGQSQWLGIQSRSLTQVGALEQCVVS